MDPQGAGAEQGPRAIPARPYTRWWWFAGPIEPADVESQLRWVKEHGFGGVELAWVYPLRDDPAGPGWLSREWSDRVAHAKRTADALGLGCDFTFGSLWPFGDAWVPPEDSHHTFDGPSLHPIRQSWESAEGREGLILDHLSEPALRRYADRMGTALAPALRGGTSSLFCDSWEVPARRMWSPHLWEAFRDRFGYRLEPYRDVLDEHVDVRYDYRAFIAEVVLEAFYRPFARICRDLGARSRVQCHGAPTDLLAAYGAVDVPETEALLVPAPFARIAASAAALEGKPVVSAEAFTCLYGFPAVGHKQERLGDLKLLADALFAHGVNHVIWHGMPYNPPGGDNAFFATVHVGPDAPFAAELPAFNDYLARLSADLRRGRTYSRLAVFLPLEDNRMRDRLPPALRTPAAHSYWELRYEAVPAETEGYLPLWVTRPFLERATYRDGRLRVGAAEFEGLYVDCAWMEHAALQEVLRLAREGTPVVWKRRPSQPGHIPSDDYPALLKELEALPNVYRELKQAPLEPLLESGDGEDLPPCWARVEGEDLWLFFAHPAARDVRYPMRPGQLEEAGETDRFVWVHHAGLKYPLLLWFPPNQSLLFRLRGHTVYQPNITFPPQPRGEAPPRRGFWSRLFGRGRPR